MNTETIDEVKPVESTNSQTTSDTTDDPAKLAEQLAATKAELAKNTELLQKVRRFEKENKEAAEKALKEQGKFKELYEEEVTKRTTVEGKFKDKLISEVLTQQLVEAKAKSINTVMKLVDKTKISIGEDLQVDVASVKLIVDELMKSDPVLFGEDVVETSDKKKESVDVKRVADTSTISSYEKEMQSAKSMQEIEAIMRKYNK